MAKMTSIQISIALKDCLFWSKIFHVTLTMSILQLRQVSMETLIFEHLEFF